MAEIENGKTREREQQECSVSSHHPTGGEEADHTGGEETFFTLIPPLCFRHLRPFVRMKMEMAGHKGTQSDKKARA